HRSRLRIATPPAEPLSSLLVTGAKLLAAEWFAFDLISLGIVPDPELEGIHPEPEGELVHGALEGIDSRGGSARPHVPECVAVGLVVAELEFSATVEQPR